MSFSSFTLAEVIKASENSATECRIRGRENFLAKTNLGIDQSSTFRSLGIKASKYLSPQVNSAGIKQTCFICHMIQCDDQFLMQHMLVQFRPLHG